MNLLLISREYPPFFGGGIGTYTVAMSRALAAHGCGCVVVTVSDDGAEHREADGAVTVVRLPFLAGQDWSAPHPAVRNPRTLAAFGDLHPVSVLAMQVADALPRLIDEFAVDAVEAPDTGAPAWFVLNERRIAGAWPAAGPPVVTVVHSPSAWVRALNREPDTPRARRLEGMEAESLLWSDGIVCPSDAVARWTERWAGVAPGSIPVVANPLGDLEEPAHRMAEQAQPQSDGPILFVGRLEPRKGLETLLGAFAELNRPDLRLVLAGRDMPGPGGPFGAGLVGRLVPERVRSNVELVGGLAPDDLAVMRRTCRAAVVPSPMDNFPYSCVEAMASGIPVVASRAGAMAHLIRDGVDGVLFEPGDASACAGALRRIADLGPGDLSEMGRSAARRVLEVCGNRRVVQRRLELIEAIRARPVPTAGEAASWIVLDRAGATDRQIRRLAEPVRRGNVSFAHGWIRGPGGRVRALATPSAAGLEDAARVFGAIGPVVVSREAAAAAGLTGSETALDAARALVRAGIGGAVVPGVITPIGAERTPGREGRFGRFLRRFRGR